MQKRTIGGCIAVVFALVTVAVAQTNHAEQRFTFKAANADKAGPSGEGRLELVVTQWSTDVERDRVLSALREHGPDKLADAIRMAYAVGYMHWPGGLDYTLRYAYRIQVVKMSCWPPTSRLACGGILDTPRLPRLSQS